MYRMIFTLLLGLVLFPACSDSYRPAERDTVQEEGIDDGMEAETLAELGHPHVPEPEVVEGNREVQAGAILLTAPETWVRRPPRSGFISAEFKLPRAEQDEQDGRLTVSVAGGSVQDNLDRWKGQFGGEPERETQDEVPIAGATVTVVDFSGTFNDAMGPFAPGEEREGYRMMGAVIPVGDRLHFVKAYGPEKTMEQHAESFRAFLQTLQVDAPGS